MQINDVARISINKRKVKEVLKSSLNYPYKKGSSGSKILKSDNNKLQKLVFFLECFLVFTKTN